MKRVTLTKWATGCALMLAAAACGPVEDESVEAPTGQAEQAVTARLSGTVLDWNDQAVANADVQLMLNGKAHGEPTLTDADGRYTLTVDVAAIQEAARMRQEITLSVYSPYEDRGAEATFEGDRIRLLPLTLREFIDMDALQDGADVNVRTAYVPLQAKGYKITPELVANGGEMTWKVPNPMGEGEDIEVTLIVEPNSIKVDGDDPQDEITLTVLDAERAPMQIPNDGFGVMWTIQPRDVR
ncbi:MAG: carboxypeptidase regulatory-like domain-containing protein, partial [Myxococcales bacterium]|nr:carboxypeptidase regulatory-like domain-containing protein [Myxococcales bacterium]